MPEKRRGIHLLDRDSETESDPLKHSFLGGFQLHEIILLLFQGGKHKRVAPL